MNIRRNKRIEEVLKEELAKIIYKEADIDPNILTTITKTEVSSDAKEAKIWVSIMPEIRRKEAMEKLNRQLPFFQHLLVKKMKIKWVPTIILVDDMTEEEAEKIEKIISKQK